MPYFKLTGKRKTKKQFVACRTIQSCLPLFCTRRVSRPSSSGPPLPSAQMLLHPIRAGFALAALWACVPASRLPGSWAPNEWRRQCDGRGEAACRASHPTAADAHQHCQLPSSGTRSPECCFVVPEGIVCSQVRSHARGMSHVRGRAAEVRRDHATLRLKP